ncbi:MAG: S24 family peptidase [Candidatus Symbiobacter sp.]|nr:S24 family peptidase [Candidatus Symbiobacter sp.]
MSASADAIRRYLAGMISSRSLTLSEVSRAIGRNHAYLQQYLQRGSPRILPEEVRYALGRYFGVDPNNFSALRDHTARGYGPGFLPIYPPGATDRAERLPSNHDQGDYEGTGTGSHGPGPGTGLGTGLGHISNYPAPGAADEFPPPGGLTGSSVISSHPISHGGGILREPTKPTNFSSTPYDDSGLSQRPYRSPSRGQNGRKPRRIPNNVFEIGDVLYVLVPYLSKSWHLPDKNDGEIFTRKAASSHFPFPIERLKFLSHAALQDLWMVDAVGDMMSPTLSHGDTVMIDVSRKNFQGDGLYVLNDKFDQLIICRCVSNHLSGKIQLNFDNPAWPSQDIAEESQFNVMGKIIWYGHHVGG